MQDNHAKQTFLSLFRYTKTAHQTVLLQSELNQQMPMDLRSIIFLKKEEDFLHLFINTHTNVYVYVHKIRQSEVF